jgi:iron complex outermembrane receptor protein
LFRATLAAFCIMPPIADAAAAETEEGIYELEEIIVTAQRRSERLLDVPIAVSVLDAADIANSGAFELSQLGDYVPNVYIRQNSDFHARIVIRGVGAHSRNIGFDTRVGVYLDGVYLGPSPSINQDVYDLDHIEVLRGPQGTLFGKNSVAGAVLLVSKQPAPVLTADVSANVYNYDGLQIKAALNVPISDIGAVRVQVSDRDNDGYITNVFSTDRVPGTINIVHPELGPIYGIPLCEALGSGSPPGCIGGPVGPALDPIYGETFLGQNVTSYRAQLALWPNERWDIRFSVDGMDAERSFVFGDALSDAVGATIDRFAPDPFQVSVSTTGEQRREIKGTSLHVDFLPGNGHRFRSITAYRDTESTYVNDSDASAFDYFHTNNHDEYEQFTQEFQWISPDDRPLTWLAGVYYYDQDSDTSRFTPIGNAGWVFGIPPGLTPGNWGTLETRSIALYFNGRYAFNERWSLGLGYRYTKEGKDTHWHLDSTGIPPGFGIGQTPPEGYIDSISEDDSSPSVHLGYLTESGVNLYARYASGFKSGGFNLDGVSQTEIDNGLSFSQETVDSWELGMKGYFVDGALFLRAAAFIADYDDYQVNQFVDLGFDPDLGTQATSVRIENAAKVETYGLELEAQWTVSERVAVDGFLGLLDAKFEDYPGGSSAVVLDPEFPGGIRRVPVNAAGNYLPEAPEVTGGLGFDFSIPVSALSGTLQVRLDALYTGGYYTTVDNERTRLLTGTHPLTYAFDIQSFGMQHEVPYGYVEDVTILNGRIKLLDDAGRWDIALWGRNLTDEGSYFLYQRDFLGALWATPRTPRMYGIEVAYHYH